MTLRKKSVATGSAATLLGGSAGAVLLALAASPAGAIPTTFTVDTLDDGVANAADCTTPVANSCSLRDALDATADGDTIVFASGLSGTISLTNGELEVGDEITIQGPGAGILTVNAGGNSRVFYLCAGPATEISGLTVTGGAGSLGGGFYDECDDGFTLRNVLLTGNSSVGGGGGLYSGGPVTLVNTVVSNNTATGGGGGVLTGNLTMVNSTISGNVSSGGGGGAYANGVVAITDSTIDSNIADNCGGGLYSKAIGSSVTITGSTFSNNSSTNCYGGAIDIDGSGNTVLIANTTITGNSARSGGGLHFDTGSTVVLAQDTIVGNSSSSTDPFYGGGGIHFDYDVAAISLSGTIVSGNTAAAGADDINSGTNAQDPGGALTADDSLLGEVDANITVTGSGNVMSTDPGVAALANNGGPTKTMALLTTSAALDAGPAAVYAFPGNAYDQRGVGFPRIVGTKADIGAFETQGSPEPTPTTATDGTVVPAFTG